MSEEFKDLPEVTSCSLSDFTAIDDGTTTSKINVSNLRKTIRPYAVWSALLTQATTNPPTADVKENTLGGDITWSRTSQGVYNGNLTGAFANASKVFTPSGVGIKAPSTTSVWAVNVIDADNIEIRTISGGILNDGYLNNTSIEIRIYY